MDNFNGYTSNWPEDGTYYLDPVNGNDSQAGTSPATAWLTHAKAEQQVLTAGQSIRKRIDGQWFLFKLASRVVQSGVVWGYYQQQQYSTLIPLSGAGSLDWAALTHLSHDHVEPNSDGSLNFNPGGYILVDAAASAAMITAAHSHNVKVLLTVADIVGGEFTAATSNNLYGFINNIVNLVTSRGYDGVDVDWERTLQQPNLNNFISALRAAMNAINPNLLLAMTASYTNENGANITGIWAQAAPFVDYINAMCYDLYPTGDLVTWFNSPLFDASFFGSIGQQVTSGWRFIRSLILQGVPAGKIMKGIPFYGRSFAGNVGTATSGPLYPRQNYPSAAGFAVPNGTYVPYNQLPPIYVAADEHWDGVAQCPYLSLVNANPVLNQYASYDDPTSLTGKAQWCIERGIAGVAIWELNLDYFSSRSIVSPLLNTIKCAFPVAHPPNGAAPPAPSHITAQSLSTSSITINWTPVPSATSYNVQRSTTSGSGYVSIGLTSGPSFTDTSVTSGTTYYYVIAAINMQTGGPNSPQATATASASTPPTTPTGLAATTPVPSSTYGFEDTTLSWTATSATSYLVKRSTMVSGGCYVIIAVVTSPTFNDTIQSGTTFYYVVSGVVAGIESANSAEITVVSPAYVPTNLLTSPGDITNAAWTVGGTGAAVASATTLNTSSSGVTSLLQQNVPVTPDAPYVVSATIFSPAVAGFVTLSVYAPGWTPIPASVGAWVQAGVAASFTLPFSSGSSTVIWELDCDANLVNATVTLSNLSMTVQQPGQTNILASPNAINVSPWSLGGSGASASGPLTLVCSTTATTSLSQHVSVAANTAYTAMMTLTGSALTAFALLAIYEPEYAGTIARFGLVPSTASQTITINFNSGAFSSIIFELDITPGAALTLTLSNLTLSVTPSYIASW